MVYIYERDAQGKLVRRATLKASDASPNDAFGSAVGVAGNVVVVGAPGYTFQPLRSINAAYVFKRRRDGRWIETQKLLPEDNQTFGEFGAAVAIDRGMIIVGAPWFGCVDPISPYPYPCPTADGYAGGAAFGFVPIAGRYVKTFTLRPRPDEHPRYIGYFEFGSRIVMFERYIAITANSVDGDWPPDFGAPHGLAFTYRRDGSTVSARGLASGYITAIALANNWLLLGTSGDWWVCEDTECSGDAKLVDLNRYVQ